MSTIRGGCTKDQEIENRGKKEEEAGEIEESLVEGPVG